MLSLFAQVDQYIEQLVANEDTELVMARQAISKAGWADQSISPVQGKLLQFFARSCQAKRILEVGTFGAYSTLWLAKALPPEGKLITIESDQEHAEHAIHIIQQSAHQHQIELLQGTGLHCMTELLSQRGAPFDFFFIDADKPPYLEYFQLAIKLARKGSIIVCDNVIRNGKVLDETSNDEKVIGVRRLNNYLKDCKEVTAVILQTVGNKEYDGMVLAVVN
ncbi:MAG: O-methyltransferase [Chitinophagaceae bacterium]|nr:O-methyltransferase [Chitinophagaceae bacterium]